MGQINVAIIGVGNCASSPVQGIHKYANAGPDDYIPGIMHPVLGEYMSEVIDKAPGPTDDFSGVLREREVDVVINYLPVGSEDATRWYAEQILSAGCGMINCIPVFIASGEGDYWQRRFRDAGAPIIGDDIKSPPVQYTDSEARQIVEDFVVGRGE